MVRSIGALSCKVSWPCPAASCTRSPPSLSIFSWLGWLNNSCNTPSFGLTDVATPFSQSWGKRWRACSRGRKPSKVDKAPAVDVTGADETTWMLAFTGCKARPFWRAKVCCWRFIATRLKIMTAPYTTLPCQVVKTSILPGVKRPKPRTDFSFERDTETGRTGSKQPGGSSRHLSTWGSMEAK